MELAEQSPPANRPGKVYLVGAGPGDPGLLTVRGRQCLEMADVVLYDGLANPELLSWAPQAEHISVGKHGQVPIWTQAAIHGKLLELTSEGCNVVRLKGGDPAVFARTAEELTFLTEHGVPFEVVPGITAALAAASYVGIPITHRDHASAVAFITGQQQADGQPQPIDWTSLVNFPGTLVFYMGVTTVKQWTTQLLRAGKPAETPAAIVRRCTWGDQTVIRCRLDEVADQLTPASKMRPPVIVILGEVAALGRDFDWFSSRPLHGAGVLVTRPKHQSQELVQSLRDLGAEVFLQPAMQIKPPEDKSSLQRATQMLADRQIAGITFSSANGIQGMMQFLAERGYDARIFGGCQLAVVGPATASACQQYGLVPDLQPQAPQPFSADGLLALLRDQVAGHHWLVTATHGSSDRLPTGLRAQGAKVTEVLCYETSPVAELAPAVQAALEANRIHWCTITSPAVATATADLLGSYARNLRAVSLSENVTERLKQLGWPPSAEAQSHSASSLVEAIVHADAQRS